jgi:hypothetical protein
MLEAVSDNVVAQTKSLMPIDDIPDLDMDMDSTAVATVDQPETLGQAVSILATDDTFKKALKTSKDEQSQAIEEYLEHEAPRTLSRNEKEKIKEWIPKIAGVKNTDRYKMLNADIKYIVEQIADKVSEFTADAAIDVIMDKIGWKSGLIDMKNFDLDKASIALSKWLLTHSVDEMSEAELANIIEAGKKSNWDGSITSSEISGKSSYDTKGDYLETNIKSNQNFDEERLIEKTKDDVRILLEKEMNRKNPGKAKTLSFILDLALKAEMEQGGDIVFSSGAFKSIMTELGITKSELPETLASDYGVSAKDLITATKTTTNPDMADLRDVARLAVVLVSLIVEGVEALIGIGDDDKQVSNKILSQLQGDSDTDFTQGSARFNFDLSNLDSSLYDNGKYAADGYIDAMSLTVAEAVMEELGNFGVFTDFIASKKPAQISKPTQDDEQLAGNPGNDEMAARMALPIYTAMLNAEKPGASVPSSSGSTLKTAQALEQTLGIDFQDSLLVDIADEVLDENGKLTKNTAGVKEFLSAWISDNAPMIPEEAKKKIIKSALEPTKILSESSIDIQLEKNAKMTFEAFESMLINKGLEAYDVEILMGDPSIPEDDWAENAVNRLSDGMPPVSNGNKSTLLIDTSVMMENLKKTVKNLSEQDKLKLSNYEAIQTTIGGLQGQTEELLGFIQNPSQNELFSLYQTTFKGSYLTEDASTTPLTLTAKRSGMGRELSGVESVFNIDYAVSSIPDKIGSATTSAASSRLSNTIGEESLVNQLGKAMEIADDKTILSTISRLVGNAVQIGLVTLNRLRYVAALAVDREIWNNKGVTAPKTWDKKYITTLRLLGVDGKTEEPADVSSNSTQVATTEQRQSLSHWLRVAIEDTKKLELPRALKAIAIAKTELNFAKKALTGSYLEDPDEANANKPAR